MDMSMKLTTNIGELMVEKLANLGEYNPNDTAYVKLYWDTIKDFSERIGCHLKYGVSIYDANEMEQQCFTETTESTMKYITDITEGKFNDATKERIINEVEKFKFDCADEDELADFGQVFSYWQMIMTLDVRFYNHGERICPK
jgi:hypothetical protein